MIEIQLSFESTVHYPKVRLLEQQRQLDGDKLMVHRLLVHRLVQYLRIQHELKLEHHMLMVHRLVQHRLVQHIHGMLVQHIRSRFLRITDKPIEN